MSGDERETVRLDEYLDAMARGDGGASNGFDPALAETIRRVHGRRSAAMPDAGFGERLWRELAERRSTDHVAGRPFGRRAAVPGIGARRSVAGRATGSPLPDRGAGSALHPWRARSLGTLATAAVVLVTLVGAVVVGRSGSRPGSSGPAAFAFYSVEYDSGPDPRYVSLDPRTLADAGEVAPFDAGALVSADGSTTVAVETTGEWSGYEYVNMPAEAVTITVRDARTGDVRASFHPPRAPAQVRALSRDGTRLLAITPAEPIFAAGEDLALFDSAVGCRGPMCRDSEHPPEPPEVVGMIPPAWYIYDAAAGRLLATWDGYAGGWDGNGWVLDGALRRLYDLVQVRRESADGDATGLDAPQPMELVVRDLTTGDEAGRVPLPTVMGRGWRPVPDTRPEPYLGPGLAVSPDGRRVAVVHANEDAVTLVDAERLAVERTTILRRPMWALDRILALLPLAPREAAAKQPEGTARSATFAPNGRHLYVHGWEFEIVPTRAGYEYRGLGLTVVNVEDGTIEAEGFADATFETVLPTPDGRELYVLMRDETWSGADKYVRRLDALTLDILAERDLEDHWQFVWRPAARETA